MHQVFLGIGGNLGNKHENLKKVLRFIENELGVVCKKSSVYETPPWGFQAKEHFWNMVVQIESELNPEELLQKAKLLEQKFGRKSGGRNYESREMDIDILFFDDLVSENERLKIPHPRIIERLFVLVPLAEIAPNLKHPVFQKTSRELLKKCPDKSEIKKVEFEINTMNNQPEIEVGIIAREQLEFKLECDFITEEKEKLPAGDYTAVLKNNRIVILTALGNEITGNLLKLSPEKPDSFFGLKNVIIGVGFHWEQQENQKFQGALKLIPEDGKVRAINVIGVEDYLKSVISSEMSATSSPELLKAHAVISRSWLLAQIEKTKSLKSGGGLYQTSHETDDEIIRWYDREDHTTFDVCADDHCQRYQGVTKIHSEKAFQAVEETRGEVLMFENKICDARFSKCCGGVSENFENVWEPVRHRYLTKVVDLEFGDTTCVDLRQEDEAELWIRNKPHAFCNTSNQKILSQVLPDFDQKTTDFYRWKVEYSQKELAELIKKRSGIDFGEIVKLEPVKRGHSSRLIKLKIIGTKKTLAVGKELEIRKWLSESHLFSSAFVVDHLDEKNGVPQKFVLTGAGWGHGVGLCQIGAAVMGEKGYSYKDILSHYFRDAVLKKGY